MFKQYTSSNTYSYLCMTYLYLPCSNSGPMTSMHGHVNEWHGIKTKKQKGKPQSKHVKDK